MGICSEAKIHEIERSEVKEEYKLVIRLFKKKKKTFSESKSINLFSFIYNVRKIVIFSSGERLISGKTKGKFQRRSGLFPKHLSLEISSKGPK